MSGHTPWSEVKHKTPPGKKVITFKQFVIWERWYVAFSWVHSRKKKPWRRFKLYWGKNEPVS